MDKCNCFRGAVCLLKSKGDIYSEQRGKGWAGPDGHVIQVDGALSQSPEALQAAHDVGTVPKGMRRGQAHTGLDQEPRGGQRDVDALSDHPKLASLADGTHAERAAQTTPGD